MPHVRSRWGFTLIELLIVLVVGGLLSTVAIRSFSQVHGSLGARTAQSTFLTMHAHARAIAVEQGQPIILVVDPGTDMVRLERQDGSLVRGRDFGAEYDVSIQTGGGTVRLCMTPRGFADPGCGNVNDRVEVRFVRGGRTRTVGLLPLGQAMEG